MDQLQPGSAWTLRNAKIEMYRGCMRLAVDQFGKLEPSDDTGIEPKVNDVDMRYWPCFSVMCIDAVEDC